MTMGIGGVVVFGLVALGVVGYAIKFRPPKVPSESATLARDWRRVRRGLSLRTRRTLYATNRDGVAAPVGLAALGAQRAEVRLAQLGAWAARRSLRDRLLDAGGSVTLAVGLVWFGLPDHGWFVLPAAALNGLNALSTLREPGRLTRSRRRLTQALFANHLLLDSDRHLNVESARA